MARPSDELRARDAEAVASASEFVVNWFLGRGQWERSATLTSLDEARAARDAVGRDQYARRGMIYAITPARQTIFVE